LSVVSFSDVVFLFFVPWLSARTSRALPVPLLEMMEATGVTVLLVSQRWLEGSARFSIGKSVLERSERQRRF
jgi:hypothetical protein